MATINCVILDDYQNVASRMADWSLLADRVTVSYLHEAIRDRTTLITTLYDADIVVAMRERTPLDSALFAALPNLKLIITSGMRNAAIDLAAAKQRDIVVCGTEGGSEAPTELTWALILGLARHLHIENRNLVQGGPWQSTLGTTLNGKKIGLIGLGKIGKKMAILAQAFGMSVCAWSPNLTRARASEAGVEFCATKDALLTRCDFVSLHLICSGTTQGILQYADLKKMKQSAYLINTSRAALLEKGALLMALKNGDIAGAGIDVFEEEPLPADSDYRQAPNLLALPHLGYVSDSNYRQYFPQTVENIQCWLAGEPVRRIN
ncbi:2-hydroxyacid dehydrogenase [[Pantoea] beijingensis]|uniref:2-hydroxyacid dehydrogenase n=2 Tax=[Pantoea] beijingensis TaxID=1324864 RepID=A0A443IDY9_9GAMM|nr:2-hydroxyacid dehydrogenase [[Pantoea] beijingensis]